MSKVKTYIIPLLSGFFYGLAFFPNDTYRVRREFLHTDIDNGFEQDRKNFTKDREHIYGDINRSFQSMI